MGSREEGVKRGHKKSNAIKKPLVIPGSSPSFLFVLTCFFPAMVRFPPLPRPLACACACAWVSQTLPADPGVSPHPPAGSCTSREALVSPLSWQG